MTSLKPLVSDSLCVSLLECFLDPGPFWRTVEKVGDDDDDSENKDSVVISRQPVVPMTMSLEVTLFSLNANSFTLLAT